MNVVFGGAGTIGSMEIGDEVMWIWGVVAIAFVVLVVGLTWFSTLRGRYTRDNDEREIHSDDDTLPRAA